MCDNANELMTIDEIGKQIEISEEKNNQLLINEREKYREERKQFLLSDQAKQKQFKFEVVLYGEDTGNIENTLDTSTTDFEEKVTSIIDEQYGKYEKALGEFYSDIIKNNVSEYGYYGISLVSECKKIPKEFIKWAKIFCKDKGRFGKNPDIEKILKTYIDQNDIDDVYEDVLYISTMNCCKDSLDTIKRVLEKIPDNKQPNVLEEKFLKKMVYEKNKQTETLKKDIVQKVYDSLKEIIQEHRARKSYDFYYFFDSGKLGSIFELCEQKSKVGNRDELINCLLEYYVSYAKEFMDRAGIRSISSQYKFLKIFEIAYSNTENKALKTNILNSHDADNAWLPYLPWGIIEDALGKSNISDKKEVIRYLIKRYEFKDSEKERIEDKLKEIIINSSDSSIQKQAFDWYIEKARDDDKKHIFFTLCDKLNEKSSSDSELLAIINSGLRDISVTEVGTFSKIVTALCSKEKSKKSFLDERFEGNFEEEKDTIKEYLTQRIKNCSKTEVQEVKELFSWYQNKVNESDFLGWVTDIIEMPTFSGLPPELTEYILSVIDGDSEIALRTAINQMKKSGKCGFVILQRIEKYINEYSDKQQSDFINLCIEFISNNKSLITSSSDLQNRRTQILKQLIFDEKQDIECRKTAFNKIKLFIKKDCVDIIKSTVSSDKGKKSDTKMCFFLLNNFFEYYYTEKDALAFVDYLFDNRNTEKDQMQPILSSICEKGTTGLLKAMVQKAWYSE